VAEIRSCLASGPPAKCGTRTRGAVVLNRTIFRRIAMPFLFTVLVIPDWKPLVALRRCPSVAFAKRMRAMREIGAEQGLKENEPT